VALASPRALAPLIDHTVLAPGASTDLVARACDEALQHGFAGVCVREEHLAAVVRRLAASGAVAPIAVADFPRGAGARAARREEVRRLAGAGAREIDVVLALPLVAGRDWPAVLDDLRGLVDAARPALLKVILETAALPAADKAAAAAVAAASGAAFVKTSTGFGPGGATADDVALLRAIVGDRVGVKASGGIRTASQALAMVRAGASRIGASASVAIVTGSF
jgi:deoxyribose-phosphate aldolase